MRYNKCTFYDSLLVINFHYFPEENFISQKHPYIYKILIKIIFTISYPKVMTSNTVSNIVNII